MINRANARTSTTARLIVQGAVVCLALLLWELAVRVSGNTLVPAPSAAIAALGELLAKGILVNDTLESIRRVLIGFSLAAFSAISFGLLLGASGRVHLALAPLIELLRPIPPIAWIPLSMSLFGLGDGSACFVIFIGAFYPVLTNTILGVREVPEQLIDAARSLGCSQSECFRKVVWPASLPSIFAGLRVGLGFAWMCVVAAEMIAARSGLGYEIQLNRQLLRLDRVVAGMLVIGVVGFLMNFCLKESEQFLLPWRRKSVRPAAKIDLPAPLPLPQELSCEISGRNDLVANGLVVNGLVANDSRNSSTAGASLTLKELSFGHRLGERPVIDKLNLEVSAGEILCLLGPSGCGKTTLLKLIAGLQTPSSGSILIDNQPLLPRRSEVTMVFQNSALFPWRTAEGNVRFSLEGKAVGKDKVKEIVERHLRLVGLLQKSENYPHELSGGQQQRVALARALAYGPRLILMDEPFASLDSQTKENLQEEVSALLFARGITSIFVTHDIREAVFLGDRVAVFSKQAGQILALHKIEKTQPRDASFRYTAQFSEARLLLWNQLKEASDEEVCPA